MIIIIVIIVITIDYSSNNKSSNNNSNNNNNNNNNNNYNNNNNRCDNSSISKTLFILGKERSLKLVCRRANNRIKFKVTHTVNKNYIQNICRVLDKILVI